jgi:hypothetical protein
VEWWSVGATQATHAATPPSTPLATAADAVSDVPSPLGADDSGIRPVVTEGSDGHFSDAPPTETAWESEIRLRAPVSPAASEEIDANDDRTPTERFLRTSNAGDAVVFVQLTGAETGPGTDETGTGLIHPPAFPPADAASRLNALVDRLAAEEPGGPVAGVLGGFLARLDIVHAAMSVLATEGRAAEPAVRVAIEAFASAVLVWQSNVVEHVDELLADDEHRTLDGWRSLPEYSASYLLAFVDPTLRDVREWGDALGPLGEVVSDVELAIARLHEATLLARHETAGGPRVARTGIPW